MTGALCFPSGFCCALSEQQPLPDKTLNEQSFALLQNARHQQKH